MLISNLHLDVQQPSPKGGMVVLETENFDVAIAELKAAGVSFDVESFETPVCRMAIIRDPDSNRLCVHKRRSHAAP
ncbi:MAG: hypothetical protein INR62_05455 [Rhodospirillales bacterium]|nr:hypothetical protein [Acetobacter sp.]